MMVLVSIYSVFYKIFQVRTAVTLYQLGWLERRCAVVRGTDCMMYHTCWFVPDTMYVRTPGAILYAPSLLVVCCRVIIVHAPGKKMRGSQTLIFMTRV